MITYKTISPSELILYQGEIIIGYGTYYAVNCAIKLTEVVFQYKAIQQKTALDGWDLAYASANEALERRYLNFVYRINNPEPEVSDLRKIINNLELLNQSDKTYDEYKSCIGRIIMDLDEIEQELD